mgnify:FL=1
MTLSDLNTDTRYWKTLKFFLIFILCNFAISKSFAQVYSFQTREFFKNTKELTKNKNTFYTSHAEINGKRWNVETDAEISSADFLKVGTVNKGVSYIVLKTVFTDFQIKKITVIAGTSNQPKVMESLKAEICIGDKQTSATKKDFQSNLISFYFDNINSKGELELKIAFNDNIKNFIVIRSIEIVNEIGEQTNNTTAITNNKGIKDNSIQINRTLSKDYWNTFCLPFDVNEDSVKLLLNNPELKEFTKEVDGTTMKFRNADSIKAGIPYIIKPSKDVVNPTFHNVIVTATEPKTITDKSGNYSFIGTYSPTELKTDGTELFLGDKDYLYKPFANDKTINGMRAFFRIKNNTSQARQSQYNIAIDETTFISLPNISITPPTTKEKNYTLDGRQVRSTHNLKAGIYIKNGKKLYVR